MLELLQSPTANAVWICFIIALASANISITITQTEIFQPLRLLANKAGHMIGYLFHCFYCMNHWVVIAAMCIYQPRLITSPYPIVDWIVTTFVTISLSVFLSGVVFKVFLTAMSKKLREEEIKQTMTKSS